MERMIQNTHDRNSLAIVRGLLRSEVAFQEIFKKYQKGQLRFSDIGHWVDDQGQSLLYNLKEMLKLASSFSEFITVNLTSRAALLDIGDVIILRFEIGSTQFVDVPAIIRDFGFDPSGLTIPVKLWSFQLIPLSNWAGSGSGIVGGYNATLTEE